MRKLLLLLFVLIAPTLVKAQTTIVSGTVTDSGGQAWANGTYAFNTAALGQVPLTGTLSATGTYTQSFPHTAATALVGDIWTATICPAFTYGCFTSSPITIQFATQTLNFTPGAIAIKVPSTPQQITPIQAYADTEITGGWPGFEYWNVTSGTNRQCTAVSGGTCSTWAQLANSTASTVISSPAQIGKDIYVAASVGADCGAKLNAADTANLGSPVRLIVDPTCGNFTTAAIWTAKHVLYIKAGSYNIATTMTGPPNPIIIGEGSATGNSGNPMVNLNWTGAGNGPIISATDTGVSPTDSVTRGCDIEGLLLTNGGSATALGGIQLTNIQGCYLNHINAHWAGAPGSYCIQLQIANGIGQAERNIFGPDMNLNCNYNPTVDASGSGDIQFKVGAGATASSFGYTEIQGPHLDGQGIDLIGGAQVYHSHLGIHSNVGSNLTVSPTSPTTGSTAGGALAATTYYIRATCTVSGVESAASTETTQAVAASNLLTVTSPACGVSNTWSTYVGTTQSAETLQQSGIANGTGWTESTSGITTNGKIEPGTYMIRVEGTSQLKNNSYDVRGECTGSQPGAADIGTDASSYTDGQGVIIGSGCKPSSLGGPVLINVMANNDSSSNVYSGGQIVDPNGNTANITLPVASDRSDNGLTNITWDSGVYSNFGNSTGGWYDNFNGVAGRGCKNLLRGPRTTLNINPIQWSWCDNQNYYVPATVVHNPLNSFTGTAQKWNFTTNGNYSASNMLAGAPGLFLAGTDNNTSHAACAELQQFNATGAICQLYTGVQSGALTLGTTNSGSAVIEDIRFNPNGNTSLSVAGATFSLPGATSGTTALAATATAGSTTATFPANTGTLAELNLVQTWSAAQSFGAGQILPTSAGLAIIGTTTLPIGTIQVGTAATNNFALTPAATAAARTINLWDFGANGPSTQNYPGITILTSQYTNSTTSFTNVAGGNTLQFPVLANTTYTAECHLYYQAAATGGLNIEFTGPASPTNVIYGLDDPSAATTFNSAVATAYGTSIGAVVGTAATNFDAQVSFSLINGANAGTVNLLAKSSAAVQLQIQAGSFCKVQ